MYNKNQNRIKDVPTAAADVQNSPQYPRNQDTAQQHCHREHLTDFPDPDLPPAEQRTKTDEARREIQEQIAAQARVEQAINTAVQSVSTL